jgi:hypothetical protein
VKARGPHFCQTQIYLFSQSVYIMVKLVNPRVQGHCVMFSLLIKLNVFIHLTVNLVILCMPGVGLHIGYHKI